MEEELSEFPPMFAPEIAASPEAVWDPYCFPPEAWACAAVPQMSANISAAVSRTTKRKPVDFEIVLITYYHFLPANSGVRLLQYIGC